MQSPISLVLHLLLLGFQIDLSVQLDNGRHTHGFCYDDQLCNSKSDRWGGTCKTGQTQSPINLPDPKSTPTPKIVKLNFNDHYSKRFWIVNTGSTIQVTLSDENTKSSAGLSGTDINGIYTFAQVHFHWARDDKGSEHTINHKSFNMEAHFVYYNSQKYNNFTEAAESGDKDGLSVVAVFIQAGNRHDRSSAFDRIVDYLPYSYKTPKHHRLRPKKIRRSLDLDSMLPESNQTFFRYYGSLTTPGCTESVQWNVVEEPIYVKPHQLDAFKDVEGWSHERLWLNTREVQNYTDVDKIEYLQIDEGGQGQEGNQEGGGRTPAPGGYGSAILNKIGYGGGSTQAPDINARRAKG